MNRFFSLRFVLILFVLSVYSVAEIQAQQIANPESARPVNAYYDKFFGAGPVASFPLSNRSFIDNVALRGLRFFYRELINERVSAGFDFSYVSYSDYLPPKVYGTSLQSVYTDLYNNVDQYAITVSGEYNFRPEARLMPFAGLGGGAAYSIFNLYYNIYSDSDRKWSGLIRPYGGAMFRFGPKSSWALFSTISLDHAFVKAPDYDYNGFSSMNIQAGLVFLDW
jgi:hypothetical protein